MIVFIKLLFLIVFALIYMPLTLMIFYGFLSICRYFARIFHGDVDVKIVKIDRWFRLFGLGKSKNEIKMI
ncbi:hypothetical protein D8X77_02490 [Vibrio vulnificus]|nr:hypothetical protein [Vibrio vulnificus]RPB32670.1 hypothetical protein CYV18_11355 [Vibrio vulnificus]HAS8251745.1 hypothetical protein [Vibrio vulnificus]